MTNYKIYTPREDSKLLVKYVRKYSKGIVLDIGTGSGIQAITAANNKKVNSVLATDIQDSIIRLNKKNIKNKKIKFLKSDLFNDIKNKKFDTIIFNPPYLPNELKVKDLTLEGGKKGYEVVERFLNEVDNFLKSDGIILIVFSSLTKKEKVDEFIKNNLLESKLLEKQHYFFEDLYVYLIKKSALLKTLEKNNIKNINYFTKGKRGFIFIGNYKNKKIAIKTKNPESEAILRINNEIKFLKILNKKNIGPKLLFSDKDYIIYKFVEGNFIIDYLKNNKKENIKKIIRKILEQMFTMDKLNINKEEMSHPLKHIIINKNNPVLIDFERTHHTIKPGNVTQFCDFLISKNVSAILERNNISINKKKVINAAKKYKKEQNSGNFNKILKTIE
jgi:release factor glutamine methyltransferase